MRRITWYGQQLPSAGVYAIHDHERCRRWNDLFAISSLIADVLHYADCCPRRIEEVFIAHRCQEDVIRE